MSRNALKIDLFRILSQNGFSFTSQDIDAFADRLVQEGFDMDESGSFWSPGGESLVTAVYRGWSDNAPTKSAPVLPKLPWSDEQIRGERNPFTRAEMIAKNDEVAGKIPRADAHVKQGRLPPGMTQAQFDALSPEQKIAAANEALRIANGYSPGGVGF